MEDTLRSRQAKARNNGAPPADAGRGWESRLTSPESTSFDLYGTLRQLDRITRKHESVPPERNAVQSPGASPGVAKRPAIVVSLGKELWLLAAGLLVLAGGGLWAVSSSRVPEVRTASVPQPSGWVQLPATVADFAPAPRKTDVVPHEAKPAVAEAPPAVTRSTESPTAPRSTAVVVSEKPVAAPSAPVPVPTDSFSKPFANLPPARSTSLPWAEVAAERAFAFPTPPPIAPVLASEKPVAIPAAPPVVQADRSASAIERLEPVFPPRARKRGEWGTVLLNVLVSEQGKVVRVVVDRGIPGPDLDAAAINTVLRWVYEPALEAGRPVRQWVREEVVFEP